jgi:hypothetical protein
MTYKQTRIYQSGEKVPFNGLFEIVGGRSVYGTDRHEIRCDFKIGEVFAAYNGMDVCWHAVSIESQSSETMNTNYQIAKKFFPWVS